MPCIQQACFGGDTKQHAAPANSIHALAVVFANTQLPGGVGKARAHATQYLLPL